MQKTLIYVKKFNYRNEDVSKRHFMIMGIEYLINASIILKYNRILKNRKQRIGYVQS